MSNDIVRESNAMEELTQELSSRMSAILHDNCEEVPSRTIVAVTKDLRKMVSEDMETMRTLSDNDILVKLSMRIPLAQRALEKIRKRESEVFEKQFSSSSPEDDEVPAIHPLPDETEKEPVFQDKSVEAVGAVEELSIDTKEVAADDEPPKKKEKKEAVDYKDFFSVSLGSSKKVKDPAQRRREITTELQKLRMEKEFSNRSLSFRSEDMVIIDALKEYSKEHAIGFEGYELTSVKGILHFAVNTMMSHLIEQNHPALNSIHKAVLKERDRQALLDKKICALEEERMTLR